MKSAFSSDAIGIEAIVKYNWARSNASFEYQGTRNETITYTNQLDFSIGFQVYFTRLQRVNAAELTVEPDNEPDPDSRFY